MESFAQRGTSFAETLESNCFMADTPDVISDNDSSRAASDRGEILSVEKPAAVSAGKKNPGLKAGARIVTVPSSHHRRTTSFRVALLVPLCNRYRYTPLGSFPEKVTLDYLSFF